jgi:TnpA family transposase
MIDPAAITGEWPELVRLNASVEAGAVLPSVILRKLAAAGPGNALSRALRALGRIDARCSRCNGCLTKACASAVMPG